MTDLYEIHSTLVSMVESGEITMEEAEVCYDDMYEQEVDNLILEVYQSFIDNKITSDECNAYIYVITESSDKSKLSKAKKDKIGIELGGLPEKEKNAIVDSIMKVSKETNTKNSAKDTISGIETLTGIDSIIKSKRKSTSKEKESKNRKHKVAKESVNKLFNLDAELELYESDDEKLHDDEETKKMFKAVDKAISTISGMITILESIKFSEDSCGDKKTIDDIIIELKDYKSSLQDFKDGKKQDNYISEYNKIYNKIKNHANIVEKYGTENQIKSYNELLDVMSDLKPSD